MPDAEPTPPSDAVSRFVRAVDSRFSRPDYMLAAIASVFLTGVGLAAVAPINGNLAIASGSVVALGLIGELLFRNPPRAARTTATRTGRPDYLRNVEYDSGCVEVWDHLSEVRHGA